MAYMEPGTSAPSISLDIGYRQTSVDEQEREKIAFVSETFPYQIPNRIAIIPSNSSFFVIGSLLLTLDQKAYSAARNARSEKSGFVVFL